MIDNELPGITLLDGTRFTYREPEANEYPIKEIARGCGAVPRFGGHTNVWYPIAMHMVNGSYLAETPEDAFDFICHDMHEGLMGYDAPTPMKHEIPEIRELEHRVDPVLAKQFGFRYPLSPAVKKIDTDMLVLENFYLRDNQPLRMIDVYAYDVSHGHALVEAGVIRFNLVSPEIAANLWLNRFYELKEALCPELSQ